MFSSFLTGMFSCTKSVKRKYPKVFPRHSNRFPEPCLAYKMSGLTHCEKDNNESDAIFVSAIFIFLHFSWSVALQFSDLDSCRLFEHVTHGRLYSRTTKTLSEHVESLEQQYRIYRRKGLSEPFLKKPLRQDDRSFWPILFTRQIITFSADSRSQIGKVRSRSYQYTAFLRRKWGALFDPQSRR